MKLALSQENRDFIEEVRAFVDEALTPEIRKRSRAGRTLDKDTQIRWQKLLHERGWIAPTGRRNMAAPAGRRSSAICSTAKLPPPARRA